LGPLLAGTVKVAEEVIEERVRQYKKWGWQKHANQTWQTIALEEFGEIANAMLEGGKVHKEIIQTAAVLVAWAEDQNLRGEFPKEEFGELNETAKHAELASRGLNP